MGMSDASVPIAADSLNQCSALCGVNLSKWAIESEKTKSRNQKSFRPRLMFLVDSCHSTPYSGGDSHQFACVVDSDSKTESGCGN